MHIKALQDLYDYQPGEVIEVSASKNGAILFFDKFNTLRLVGEEQEGVMFEKHNIANAQRRKRYKNNFKK